MNTGPPPRGVLAGEIENCARKSPPVLGRRRSRGHHDCPSPRAPPDVILQPMSKTPENGTQAGGTAEDWAAKAEARVLDAALPLAGETGWTQRTLQRAAQAAGLTAADCE